MSAPNITASTVLQMLIEGKFAPMDKEDFDTFAGAEEGSVIFYEPLGGPWTLIVSPAESGAKYPFEVHAYHDDGHAYRLTSLGWSLLNELAPNF